MGYTPGQHQAVGTFPPALEQFHAGQLGRALGQYQDVGALARGTPEERGRKVHQDRELAPDACSPGLLA